ncbi:hypothetical protein V1527DRAFT_462402 [Lipomyces starkeyi]
MIRSRWPPKAKLSLFLFFLTLFAFWLRSSVVSVLFSVTTEMSLFVTLFVTLIFVFGIWSSGLAYGQMHCVVAIALPATDANIFIFSL